MKLEEVRKQIDKVDPELRNLIMQRMDCSELIAQTKQEAGSSDIYRADREAEILNRLSEPVPEERKAEYLAVVRKIMEASRMYQYGLMYDWNEGFFEKIPVSTDAVPQELLNICQSSSEKQSRSNMNAGDMADAASSGDSCAAGTAERGSDGFVYVSLTCPERKGGFASICSMIADYGFDLTGVLQMNAYRTDSYRMNLQQTDSSQSGAQSFCLGIAGNLEDVQMRKLMFQLWKECRSFCILQ